MKDTNKRGKLRVPFKADAVIFIDDTTVSGTIKNMSLSGLFINTEKKLDVNSEIDIDIHLSGSTTDLTFKVHGIVERSDENGTAIKIDSMELDSYTYLKNIIAYSGSEVLEFD